MKKILFLPLLLTLIAGCSNTDKTYIERRDDCAEVIGQKISVPDFIKKYNLASREDFEFISKYKESSSAKLVANFCSFYRLGNTNY